MAQHLRICPDTGNHPTRSVGKRQTAKTIGTNHKGQATETVTTFPYTTTLKDNTISISKTGSLPVYITGYQQFWNGKPEKVSKDFTVNTWFEKKGDKLTRLKGGEAVQLKAEVTVRGDADFVMVEIPYPRRLFLRKQGPAVEQQRGTPRIL
jgi:hypothetical protein